jgi:putative redox protein
VEARQSRAFIAKLKEKIMTASRSLVRPVTQAVVAGDIGDGGALTGRVGAWEFPIEDLDAQNDVTHGPSPYDLLSASLAACTAMTIRLHARHKNYPLSFVEVAVSFHHEPGDSRGSFRRTISLRGDLDENQRALLVRGASSCPVGKSLSLTAEIQTTLEGGARAPDAEAPASYVDDLQNFSIINIDPD